MQADYYNQTFYRQYYYYVDKDLEDMPYFRIIRDTLALKPEETLLDAGCGVGYTLDWLRRKSGCRALGFDFSGEAVKIAKKKYPQCSFVLADIYAIPFRNDIINKIICINVLEHLRNPSEALQELQRVVSVHGISVFGTPDRRSYPVRVLIRSLLYLLREKHSPCPTSHVHEFTLKELSELLTRNGKVEKVARASCSGRFSKWINNVISKMFPYNLIVKVRKL